MFVDLLLQFLYEKHVLVYVVHMTAVQSLFVNNCYTLQMAFKTLSICYMFNISILFSMFEIKKFLYLRQCYD